MHGLAPLPLLPINSAVWQLLFRARNGWLQMDGPCLAAQAGRAGRRGRL